MLTDTFQPVARKRYRLSMPSPWEPEPPFSSWDLAVVYAARDDGKAITAQRRDGMDWVLVAKLTRGR